MDSLLSTYASSDDEESPPPPPPPPPNQQSLNQSKPSKFSLPPPKSSSSSLFSSLPPAKTCLPDPQPFLNPLPVPTTKKVVQFRPPVNLSLIKSTDVDDEDDYEDEEEKERKRKKAELAGQTSSVKSFLSNIPAPRNSVSLGVLGSGLGIGIGRKSVIDADVQESDLGSGNYEKEVKGENTVGGESCGIGNENYANYDGYSGYGGGDIGGDSCGIGNENYANFDGYSGYGGSDGNVVDYNNYSSNNVSDYNWNEGSSREAVPEVPIEQAFRLPTKRGRRDDPPQIIEVNQDELMKNRPREDQAKSTGIAFGPAYQPASSKGKPTKLHKRKHQIGALYFDMKSKESELAERRSKGFLTKAQTQGKYGW